MSYLVPIKLSAGVDRKHMYMYLASINRKVYFTKFIPRTKGHGMLVESAMTILLSAVAWIFVSPSTIVTSWQTVIIPMSPHSIRASTATSLSWRQSMALLVSLCPNIVLVENYTITTRSFMTSLCRPVMPLLL